MKSSSFLFTMAVALLGAACGVGIPDAEYLDDASQEAAAPARVVKEYGGQWETLKVTAEGKTHQLKTQFHGVIGVPQTAGPHPVVVILHGSHAYCSKRIGSGDNELIPWPCPSPNYLRNDVGFTYLVRELSAKGFIALAIDANVALSPVERPNWEADIASALVDRHLKALATARGGGANPFGVSVSGADLTQLTLIGHSRGGEWAYRTYFTRRARGNRTDGTGAIDALLFVAPTLPASGSVPVMDVPSAVILPECDGDVSTLEGQHYLQQARVTGTGSAAIKLLGAGHTGFNSGIKQDSAFIQEISQCQQSAYQLPAASHRTWLAKFTSQFLRSQFGMSTTPLLWNERTPLPATLHDLPVSIAAVAPKTLRAAVPLDSAVPVQLTVQACSLNGWRLNGCGDSLEWANHGGGPLTLLRWTSTGAALKVAVPAAARLPGAKALSLRFVPDPTSTLNAAKVSKQLKVTLTDARGVTASATVDPNQSALRPPVAGFWGGSWFTGLVPGTIRLPWSVFGTVDPSQLTEIRFDFADTAGQVLVSEIDLLK